MQAHDIVAMETPESIDTPLLRAFALLELIAGADEALTLQQVTERTGLPKPSLHRMLQQLEGASLLQRTGDGRRYAAGTRLRRLAESALLNDVDQGARRAVLRDLVERLGESCNLTALSGSEVVYLDRVETSAPLRFTLHPGSRVPVHCSASGKLFLAQLTPGQRRRLLGPLALRRHTPNTLTTLDAIEHELARVRQQGYAIDNEEFLGGLFCVAVSVPVTRGRSNLCVAVQAPVMRLNEANALATLPALREAALALARAMHPAELSMATSAEDESHGPAAHRAPQVNPASASAGSAARSRRSRTTPAPAEST